MKRIFALLLTLCTSGDLRAFWNSEYQFGVEVAKPENDPLLWNKTSAFLWVPPKAERVRAVVLAPANIIERRICDDSIMREAAERDSIALLFFQAGWKGDFVNTPRAVVFIQSLLDRLAEQSGYAELRTVAWIPFGHSGNSQFCQAMARQCPERIAANIVVKGALPGPAKDGSTTGLVGIPILFVTGEFEEVAPPGGVRNAWWGVQMKRFAEDRAAVLKTLITGMEDRSHGHLNWFPEMSRFVAMYIHKALAARLRSGQDRLAEVPFESGWLCDPEGARPTAPVSQYAGDAQAAFWLFDEELARAWEKLFWRDKGKKEQLLAFVQNGAVAPWWNGWAVQSLQFQPLADGRSFSAEACFRDEIPKPFADAGIKLGHSTKAEIEYQILGWAGAMEQTGPRIFRVRFDREGVNGRTVHVLLGASHPGDAGYRETVAVASFDVPYNNSQGVQQKITFPPIDDVRAGVATVPLNATVDSGLKPDYYVLWGPAVIDGDKLRITAIPARARFPIEIKVTAYQWGKASEPKFATASPVTRTFHLIQR